MTRSVAITISPEFSMTPDKCKIVQDYFDKRGWHWKWVNEASSRGGEHSHAGVILPAASRTAAGDVKKAICRVLKVGNPKVAVICKTWYKQGWDDVYMEKEGVIEESIDFPKEYKDLLADDVPLDQRRASNLFKRYDTLTALMTDKEYVWDKTFRGLCKIYNTLCFKDRLMIVPSDPRRQKHEVHMWMKFLMKYDGCELGDPTTEGPGPTERNLENLAKEGWHKVDPYKELCARYNVDPERPYG